MDSTLTFAAKRNVPVRYNRELVATTLKAMSRIEEIRQKRERAFYKNRMRGNKERQIAADKKIVEKHPELLRMRDVELARKAEKAARRAENEEAAMEEEVEEEEEDLDEEVADDSEMDVESDSETEAQKVKVALKARRKGRSVH